MGKPGTFSKSLACSAGRSSGKLDKLGAGRVRHYDESSSHLEVGRKLIPRPSSRGALNIRRIPALPREPEGNSGWRSQQAPYRDVALDRTPDVPRRNIVSPDTDQVEVETDRAPSIPQRCPSIQDRIAATGSSPGYFRRPESGYNDNSGDTNNQHNAVFDGTTMTKARTSPLWQSMPGVDRAPTSYRRTGSVSTLFNSITLRSNQNSLKAGLESSKSSPKSVIGQMKAPEQAETVEVTPGVHATLRNAKETWSCVQKDFYKLTSCNGCAHELTCIKDLDYVQCPKCTFVSPVDDEPAGGCRGGGVGVGFTFNYLQKWEKASQIGRW